MMQKIIYILSLTFVCSYGGTLDSTVTNSASERIINGQNSTHQEYLYAVSIQRISGNVAEHACGGALITYRHVLTAARCTYSIGSAGNVIPIVTSELRVFAGADLLTNTSNDRIRNVANYTVHPNHIVQPSHVNDIAILNLIVPFPETVVRPLPLAAANSTPADFTVCSVAGWGARTVGSTTPSAVLQISSTYIYNHDTCAAIFHSVQNLGNVLPTMICAANFNALAANCDGDQGNALVCDGALTGVLFLPTDCLKGVSINPVIPEIYTKVSNYTTWIQSVTSSSSALKSEIFAVLILTIFQGIFMKVAN
ncbi:trypsin delta-like [Galleria mellonella]|uniref:Trypsin delta-like n=1 Tax=Galleria mellonella TaxID=7137 RepID=A0A6J1WT35_GALME|nr:trypsin delta-like [Galleria mellonella]